MWFYAEKWYQKLPFRDRPLFSRLDAPMLGNGQNFFAKLLSKSNNLCGGSVKILHIPGAYSLTPTQISIDILLPAAKKFGQKLV